jgi:5-methylcytosine-specific restriction endonuclease McrA
MPHVKGPGGDMRPGAKVRRELRRWVLATFGDGITCNCVHCGTPLDNKMMQLDRIVPDGRYNRENIQPSCGSCNVRRRDDVTWVYTPV